MSAAASCVAIVAGVPEELAALRGALGTAREAAFGSHRGWSGTLAGRDVVLAVAGDGAARAESVLSSLLDVVPCSAVVGLGVAGAVSRDLAVGDLVVATEVRGSGPGRSLADPAWAHAALAAGALPAVAVTVPSIVATPGDKTRLAASCPGARAVVDLESATWARLAASRGLPWVVLRVVSDGIDEELPRFLIACQRADGSIDRGRVAARAIVAPWRVAALLRLQRRVREASHTLARAAGSIMQDAASGISRQASREAM